MFRSAHASINISKSASVCTRIALVALAVCVAWSGATVAATDVTGFVEANVEVEVASSESGVLKDLLVKAGQSVENGQPIATLDDELQTAQLELAKHLATSLAELQKAQAELSNRRMVYEHLTQLSEKGYAQQKELLRAKMELDIANAGVLAREERVIENQLRTKVAKLNLERRTIVSPITGVVSEINREAGEFVSPVDPHVVTVLQIDPVVALFQIAVADVEKYKVGQPVKVAFQNGVSVAGEVESIGVVAESETVALKIRLPNKNHRILSGQRCVMTIPPSHQFSQRSKP